MADLTKNLDNTLNQRLPPLQKMEFYSLGKETKNPSLQFAHNNIGFAVTFILFRIQLLIYMIEIT